MSVAMIQKKCGRRPRVARFVRGELSLLNAALNRWSVRNGFPVHAGGMAAVIRDEMKERTQRRRLAPR